MERETDGMLMMLAQRSGGIEPLLETFFEFLHRRTDLYNVIPDHVEDAKLGFRKGVAEQMVLKAFHKFPLKTLQGKPLASSSSSSSSKAPTAPDPPSNPPSSRKEASQKKELEQLASELRRNEDGKQLPLPGNGGVTDTYFWQQTLDDLTIHLAVPDGTSAKKIECEIGMSSLSVRLESRVLLDGKYPNPEKVKAADSFWTLEKETSTMVIHLDKSRETWWPCVLQGEPEIDTTQVDSTRRVDEYDELTQAHIRKIMFDQQQKIKGLPTSDEIQKEDILRKAAALPGSPFLNR